MLETLERWWRLNDKLPDRADAIVLISYGATKDRLTIASVKTTDLALALASKYPRAVVLWCTFSKNPDADTEFDEKADPFLHGMARHRYAGPASSSTDECQAIMKKAKQGGILLGKVIVVAEGCHSRRDRLVWRHFLPKAELCFKSVPGPEAEDPNNPMRLQRNWRKWLIVNIVLFPLYKWFPGVAWFAKRNWSQPT